MKYKLYLYETMCYLYYFCKYTLISIFVTIQPFFKIKATLFDTLY
jgi:hypothetical protein